MDKPRPLLSCSTLKPDLPGRLTMLRSHAVHQLISCTLLLLVSLSSLGESRPHVAHNNTPDADRMDSQKVLLLEAVKIEILSSLDVDREPRPAQKVSEQELRKMYQLYRDKLVEMRRNSSQKRETWQSTVLFSATGEIFVWQGGAMEIPSYCHSWLMRKAILKCLSGSRKKPFMNSSRNLELVWVFLCRWRQRLFNWCGYEHYK